MADSDLIKKGQLLKFIEDIKCNRDIPKNYGTLLDIMRHIRSVPNVEPVGIKYKNILTHLLKRYTHEIIFLYAEDECVDDLESILSDLGISSDILDKYRV